jgi:HK97 family phage major capsid protein
MNFVKKSTEELEKMTPAELDQYKNDLEASNKAELKAELSADNKKELEKATNELKEFMSTEIGKQLLEVTSKGTQSNETFYDALKNAIISKKDEIAQLKNSSGGSVKLEVNKAVVNMTFATNSTGRIGRVEGDNTFYGIERNKPFLGDLISLGTTNARTYYWIDKTGYEGAPAMTAEGALKPVGDYNLVEQTANPKKVAFIVTISKEMLDDIDGMAQDVIAEIREQITDVMEQQWLAGDGTGDNISGILDNATPFAAGSLAGTIDEANEYDVLRAAIKQVQLNNFQPNAILLNPSDAAQMDLDKGTDGHYLLPPFSSADNTVVKGVRVVVSNYVTAGDFVVGDLTRYKGKMRENITIDMGYKDGDWQKNFVSFRGEARFFGYIPTNHYGAIVTGDFTVAKAALETA